MPVLQLRGGLGGSKVQGATTLPELKQQDKLRTAGIIENTANPAGRIKARYAELMAINDHETLQAEALALVEGGGISPKNKDKFVVAVRTERSLQRLQFYLTNFVLAASGHVVLRTGPRG